MVRESCKQIQVVDCFSTDPDYSSQFITEFELLRD